VKHAVKLIAPLILLITSCHGPHRKRRSSVTFSNYCLASMLVCEVVTQ
jgi:hypothetical protein